MPYIGNPIYQSAFVVDQFSGDGTTVAFTMSVAPAGTTNVLVVVSGVVQDPSTYGVVGNTLTFSAAPPSGTGNISCRYLGVPVTGVTTTAYRTVTEFTATAGQTTFTPPSYNVGFINVYLNGVLLGSADYTATNGTTVVLATGAAAGNLVTVESFQISSVANAIANAAGSVSSSNLASGIVTPAKLSTGGPYWDTSGNLGVGTNTPAVPLAVYKSSDSAINIQNSTSGLTNVDGLQLLLSGSNGYMWNYENGANIFGTNNIERMRIDSSGRVTTPYQPAFAGTLSSGVVPGSSAKITTITATVNVGNHWVNGTFTCPVAGKYIVSDTLMKDAGLGQVVHVDIYKNGISTYNRNRMADNSNYLQSSISTVVNCAANDTLEFYWFGSCNCLPSHDAFLIYLLG